MADEEDDDEIDEEFEEEEEEIEEEKNSVCTQFLNSFFKCYLYYFNFIIGR